MSVLGGAVDGRRIPPLVAHRGGAAVSRSDPLGDALDLGLDLILDRRLERARGAAQHRLLGDHVPGIAGVELRHRDHDGIERTDGAARDGLQRADDLGRHHHRIDAALGHRGMAADPGHGDLEDIERRHHGALHDAELAGRHARPVVHAVDRLDRKFVEQALLDHDAAAALVLLGRLEDEMHRAVEIARLGQIASRAEQHGRMAVMAAGMHPASILRAMLEAVLLVDVERIHIGTQPNRAPTRSGLQGADHAGAGQPRASPRGRTRPASWATTSAVRCSSNAVSGWAVDVAAPCRHLVVIAGDAIDDRHGGLPKLRPQWPGITNAPSVITGAYST